MKNRKGDISMNTIVYVAIAIFVLVIIIGFATGTFQKLFSGVQPSTEVEKAQSECAISCNAAEDAVLRGGIGDWPTTDYCTKTYSIDVNEDDEIDPTTEILHCWSSPLVENCIVNKQLASGEVQKCSVIEDSCVCEAITA